MIKFVLGLLPWWAWAALLAVAIATATAWHMTETRKARNEGRAEVQAKWDALEAERNRVAATDALRRGEANIVVTDTHRKQVAKSQAAAATARSELERLHDALAERDRAIAAATGPRVDDSAAIAKSLGECSSEYQAVAGISDRLADQVTGLQAYVQQVCLKVTP